MRFDEDLGVPVVSGLAELDGVTAKAGARVLVKTATDTFSGLYDGSNWLWNPPMVYPFADLPLVTDVPLGTQLVVSGTFASDVTKVLLTCDMVKNVKSWTGQVVSVTTNTGDELPETVTWTTTP